MVKSMIISDYQEYIELNRSKMPDGLYTSLKSNERMPQFLNKLKAEFDEMSRRGISLERHNVKNIVYNMTEMFITLVKRQADEKAMSSLERTRVLAEANKTVTADEAADIERELVHDKILILDDRNESR